MRYRSSLSFAIASFMAMMAPALAAVEGESRAANSCVGLPGVAALKTALVAAVKQANVNKGLGFNMWATLVANDGTVCAVTYSGANVASEWLASRVISAQKAFTASSLSLGAVGGASAKGKFALSSANLYSATRDGGSLLGLQFANVVDPAVAYHVKGQPGTIVDPATLGTGSDPMVGQTAGGANVFGGGLVAVNAGGQKVGGVGVSGDTSCTDHIVAWYVRRFLNLDFLKTAGISGPAAAFAGDIGHPDNIIFDFTSSPEIIGFNRISPSGFGHPTCINTPDFNPTSKTPLWLPAVR